MEELVKVAGELGKAGGIGRRCVPGAAVAVCPQWTHRSRTTPPCRDKRPARTIRVDTRLTIGLGGATAISGGNASTSVTKLPAITAGETGGSPTTLPVNTHASVLKTRSIS